MGYSKKTPNYELPLYVGSDRPSYLGDWNGCMNTIDGQMKANANGIIEGKTATANMKKYVDDNVSALKASVNSSVTDSKNYVDGKVAGFISKSDADKTYSKLYKNVLYIGDSFLGLTGNWGSVLTTLLAGKQGFAPATTTFQKGSTGFVRTVESVNFQTLLQNALSAATSAFDLIVIGGGVNDMPNESGMTAAMQNIESSIRTGNKGVIPDVYVFANLWGDKPSYGIQYEDNVRKLKLGAAFSNVVSGCWTWLYDTVVADGFFSSDRIHPTAAGSSVMANCMMSVMSGGDPTVYSFRTPIGNATAGLEYLQRDYLNIQYSCLDWNSSTQNLWIQEKYTPFNSVCVGCNVSTTSPGFIVVNPDLGALKFQILPSAGGISPCTNGKFTFNSMMNTNV